MQGETSKVAKRRVFYIPGYDPIHPRRYRELYRTEGAEQAKISGYRIELSSKQGDGQYGWQVNSAIDGGNTHADFEVLVWSDIVKSSMEMNIPRTYLMLARTAWVYITSGALRRLTWLRKGPVIAALYPVGVLLLQLLVAVLVAWFVGANLAKGVLVLGDWPMIARMLAWGAAFPLIVVILRGFRKLDNKLYVYYLMHDYAYSARSKGAYSPELEARMAEFGNEIAKALSSDVDEVLVVGHSSGAHIGVSVLADLIRANRVPAGGPALALLTLGQVIPMVSFLPRAYRLRADLKYLSTCNKLIWVDVSAPGDGCAFALCDPVAVTGVTPSEGKRWPLVFSAAFSQTLSPNRLAELRWKFFRLHLQYMCAFDRPGEYDYFKITAGPVTLSSRYSARPISRSRIDVAASPHTSVVAPTSLR